VRVLVLGAAGMLGHKLLQVLSERFTIAGRDRRPTGDYLKMPVLSNILLYGGVDAEKFSTIKNVVEEFQPDVILNAIGVVKQLKEAKAPIISISINALLPHKLAELCAKTGTRLVHFSTDCVFSGAVGGYKEKDNPDPLDIYGRSKLLGEVYGSQCLTLRTSIVGRELSRHTSLIDWFLGNSGGTVTGFSNAVYSGLTTQELSHVVGRILVEQPSLSGLWHVSSEPISKFDLLTMLDRKMNLNIQINKDVDFRCDRSLDSTEFWKVLGGSMPTWDKMTDQLLSDKTPYCELVSQEKGVK